MKESLTLGECAEQWYRERGKVVPIEHSAAWEKMYTEFCRWTRIGNGKDIVQFVQVRRGKKFRDADLKVWTKVGEFTCVDTKGKSKLFTLYETVKPL